MVIVKKNVDKIIVGHKVHTNNYDYDINQIVQENTQKKRGLR